MSNNNVNFPRRADGYTIVELITAVAVLAVAFIAVFGAVRYMRHEQMADYHRRHARMAIDRIFEGAFSSYVSSPGIYRIPFELVAPGGGFAQSDRLEFSVNTASSADPDDAGGHDDLKTYSSKDGKLPKVCIDCRPGYERVEADIDIGVGFALETLDVGGAGGGGSVPKDINTHIIRITLNWKSGGGDETLALTKRLAPKTWN